MNLSKAGNNEITGLIISAGKSSRMGEYKPLMNYAGKSFLNQIISKLDTVCHCIIIVTGYNSEKLKSQTIKSLGEQGQDSIIKKIIFIKNNEYEKGMFTSLKSGLKEIRNTCPETLWVLYHFIDQPGLPDDFYPAFIKNIDSSHNWIQPSFNKQNGHPILLGKELYNIILDSSDSSSLREVSRNPAVRKKIWECPYKNVLQDIDTREDYLSDTNS
jgi:molybdenum cofactor cytidylyltransferase